MRARINGIFGETETKLLNWAHNGTMLHAATFPLSFTTIYGHFLSHKFQMTIMVQKPILENVKAQLEMLHRIAKRLCIF